MKNLIVLFFTLFLFSFSSVCTYANSSLIETLINGADQIANSDGAKIIRNTTESAVKVATTSKITKTVETQLEDQLKWLEGTGGKRITAAATKDMSAAIDSLRSQVKKTPNNTRLLIKLAVAYEFGGKYALALNVAEKVLMMNPNNTEAAILKADCYKLQGNTDAALKYLEGYTKKYESSQALKRYLAKIKTEIAAEKELIREIGLDVNDSALYKKLAEVYTLENKNGIKLFANGKLVDTSKYENAVPISVNGSVFVPVKIIVDKFNGKMKFDNDTKTLTLNICGKEIVFAKDGLNAKVDGKTVKLNQAIKYANGKAYIPLKFIKDELSKEVSWYNYSKYGIVVINDKK